MREDLVGLESGGQQHETAPEHADAAFAAGCHWGTFQLTNEGIEEPPTDLASALQAEEISPERFRALRPGEVWSF